MFFYLVILGGVDVLLVAVLYALNARLTKFLLFVECIISYNALCRVHYKISIVLECNISSSFTFSTVLSNKFT